MGDFGGRVLSDLKGDLASLRIDREGPARSAWRWPLLLLVPVVAVLGAFYAVRARGALQGVAVETANATLTSGGAAGGAGSPVLAASGYLVARRKAVVSAKIQGRLA